MKKIYSVLILLLSVSFIYAQTLNNTSIPFQKNGQYLKYAQIGGLNSPQFHGVDMNNDGLEDLVVFDRKGDVLLPFLYNGSDYVYAPQYVDKFPPIRYFMLTFDYNCDGIKDIFCYPIDVSVDGLAVYTGSYDANNKIQFTQKQFPSYYYHILNFPGHNNLPINIAILKTDIPALEDFDGDGDMDIVTFDIGGSWAHYYENQSADLGYGCDSLLFEKKSDCWGRFAETGVSVELILSPSIDSCIGRGVFLDGGRVTGGVRNSRHAGSTLTPVDMDNDGDMDIILGDLSFPDLNLLINGGNPDTSWITAQDIYFPSNSTHAAVPDFPAAFLFDVDKDGDRDMIAARNEDSDASENYFVSWYYKNNGSEALPVYDYVQNDFIVGETIDYGTYSIPVFFDHNADGLMDIVIGNLGLFQAGGVSNGALALYENVGTVDTPQYNLITEDYLNTAALGLRRLAPAFGDVDNDGDDDLLLGEEFGGLYYFENTAGTGNPATFAAPVPNYQNIDVVQASIPQIIDIDRDSKNDIIIGQNQGFIKYYRNTGTASNPTFTLQPAPNNTFNAWGDVDARPVGFSQGYAAPRVVEVNGFYELFVGNVGGEIMHFTDVEIIPNGPFTLSSPNYAGIDIGGNATLDIADINNDGSLEFLIGNSRGGITIKSEGTLNIPIRTERVKTNLARIFPNPTNTNLNIELADNLKDYSIIIYNAIGQPVYQAHGLNDIRHQLNVSDWASGVYFTQIRAEGVLDVKTVIVGK